MGDFAVDEGLRDDTDHPALLSECRVCKGTHQANASTAIHNFYIILRARNAKLGRRVHVRIAAPTA